MTKQYTNITKLTKSFWELSRVRQESFLKELYGLSAKNKDLFQIRLTKDYTAVLKSLEKSLDKETIGRIGKFKKIRLSKINEQLRNAEKLGIPIRFQMELRKKVWQNMFSFFNASDYWPEKRYEVACARHLDVYLTMVDHHVLEMEEKKEILEKNRQFLLTVFKNTYYYPHIQDIFMKHFHKDSV